ncbi:YdeI/OmpD-associated family protein [Klenkia sp. LSe6-5]|uniref:YdeI/OmpD-associated family protein n=1 Tax=Klenkia sesuvii TaxID=3103137 RepID=A0ABU8DTM4_9ACTN
MTVEPREYVDVAARLELLAWGRNTYTVLYLDDLVEDAVRAAGTRRVEGFLDDVPVNLGVNRADVAARAFCYVGPALQRRVRAEAGDVLRCRLRPADPDHVPLPDDVRRALEVAGRLAVFEGRRPSERRRALQPVEDAVRDTTRQTRIAALVRSLAPG